MNQEITSLKESIKDHEEFRLNLEPQLENARKEIELNKSMLIMLNNEINVINQEKNQLEKRLLNNRRLKTPSVIIEEEEEDLAEEQYVSNESNYDKDLIKIDNDKDVEFIAQNSKDTDGILILNKQIEDMTFYIDELKSELEVEREKNVEINNELIKSRNEIEKLKVDLNNELKFEKESKESTSNIYSKTDEEEPTEISTNKSETIDTLKENLDNKLKSVFNVLINEVIDNDNYNYDDSFKNLNDAYSDNQLNDLFNDLVAKYKLSIEKRDNISKSQSERLFYIESQMEKVIKDYKTEIDIVQNQMNSKDNEFSNFKTEVIFISLSIKIK
jgi:hypothetical protein